MKDHPIWHQAMELERKGDYTKAITGYKQWSEVPDAWFRISVCHERNHTPVDAIHALRKAITLNPSVAKWHIRLGKLLQVQQHKEAAIAAYEDGIRLDDSHPAWHADLGYLLLDVSPTKAKHAFAAAVALGKDIYRYEIEVLNATREDLCYQSPRRLLKSNRFDLAAKILYLENVCGLPNFHSAVDGRFIYTAHILVRTGGREPGKTAKNSIKHYLSDFDNLLTSMKKEGFDRRHPITVARDGTLTNAAHRTAAALVLNKPRVPVYTVDRGKGIDWGLKWFITNGFLPQELDAIIYCWLRYNTSSARIAVIQGGTKKAFSGVVETLKKAGLLIVAKRLPQDRNDDLLLGTSQLNGRSQKHSTARHGRLSVALDIGKKGAVNHARKILDEWVGQQSYRRTVYFLSSSQQQTLSLAEQTFNNNSAISQHRTKVPHGLREKLQSLERILQRSGYALDHVCIVGHPSLARVINIKSEILYIAVPEHSRLRSPAWVDECYRAGIQLTPYQGASEVFRVHSDDELLMDASLHEWQGGVKWACVSETRNRYWRERSTASKALLEKLGIHLNAMFYVTDE